MAFFLLLINLNSYIVWLQTVARWNERNSESVLLTEDARDRFIGQEGSSTGRYGAAGYIGLLNRQVQYFS